MAAGSRGLTVDELMVAAGKEEGVSMVEIRAGKVLKKYAPLAESLAVLLAEPLLEPTKSTASNTDVTTPMH